MSEKPMIYGTIQDVSPPTLDLRKNVYQVHDEPIPDCIYNAYSSQVFFVGQFITYDDTSFIYDLMRQEVTYDENMPGMTLDEFQAWSDQIINESKCEEEL